LKNQYKKNVNRNLVERIILKCFFPEGKEITIKEIQNKCNYSYERVNTSLKELVKKNIIQSEKIGKTLRFKADFENLNLKLAFYTYSIERLINFKNKYPIIYKAIKELEKEVYDIILIFGSYSKEKETKESDIDLMIISNSKKEKPLNSIIGKYGLRISPVFISMEEFSKIKLENKELFEDIKKNGVIFKGENLVYMVFHQNENS